MNEDLIYRLRKRAEIRRQIADRKSVQEGKPDRISDLLEEAANALEQTAEYDELSLAYMSGFHDGKKKREWVELMRGIRVEGDAVIITVKGGNEAARQLCGELFKEKERNT